MIARAFLDQLRRLPMTTPAAFTRGEPFVVLAPHPDDESLGVGGLLAASCEAGQAVRVVILTDGAGSHPGSQAFPPARLAALRRTEVAAAAEHLGLGPDHLVHLDCPDTRAPTDGPTFDAVVNRLEGIVRAAGATMLLVTWNRDPHCDHAAAAAIARAVRERMPALALWFYPIWGWHLDPDVVIDEPAPLGFRLDIAPWAVAKSKAIAAHASQMTDLIADDPSGFRFTAASIAPFTTPVETVFEVP